MALVLLLAAALVTVPSPAIGSSTDCGVVVEQDDARQDRDAGASPSSAVELPGENHFPASISYPQGTVVDAEDWFHLDWTTDEKHRVMVNVSTRAQGLSYVVDQRLPAPHISLEAYQPGDAEPTHEGELGDDGVVRLDFVTERSAWDVRVFLTEAQASQACPTDDGLTASSELQVYGLYWGCDPHCLQTS